MSIIKVLSNIIKLPFVLTIKYFNYLTSKGQDWNKSGFVLGHTIRNFIDNIIDKYSIHMAIGHDMFAMTIIIYLLMIGFNQLNIIGKGLSIYFIFHAEAMLFLLMKDRLKVIGKN